MNLTRSNVTMAWPVLSTISSFTHSINNGIAMALNSLQLFIRVSSRLRPKTAFSWEIASQVTSIMERKLANANSQHAYKHVNVPRQRQTV